MCKAIAKHYIVRGNIIAAIVTTLPIKVDNRFKDGFFIKINGIKKRSFCFQQVYQNLIEEY